MNVTSYLSKILGILFVFGSVQASGQWEKVDLFTFFTSQNQGVNRVFNVKGEYIWCGNSGCLYTKDFVERRTFTNLSQVESFLFNGNLYYSHLNKLYIYEGNNEFKEVTSLPNTGSPYRKHLQYDNHVVLQSGELWGIFDGQKFDTLHVSLAELLHHNDSLIFYNHQDKLVRYNYHTQNSDTLDVTLKKNSRPGFQTVLNYHYIPYQDKLAFFEDSGSGATRAWITDGKSILMDTILKAKHKEGFFSVHRNQLLSIDRFPMIQMEDFYQYKSLIYTESEAYDLFNSIGWLGIDEQNDRVVFIQKDSKLYNSRRDNSLVTKLHGKEIGFGFFEDDGFELFAIENNKQELLFNSNSGFYGLFLDASEAISHFSRKVGNELYFYGVDKEKGVCLYKTDGSKENSGLISCLPELIELNNYRVSLIHLNTGIGLLFMRNGELFFYQYTGETIIQGEETSNQEDFEIGITYFSNDKWLVDYGADELNFQRNKNGNVLLKAPRLDELYDHFYLGALITTKKQSFRNINELPLEDVYSVINQKGNILYNVKISYTKRYGNHSQGLLNDQNELILFVYARDSIQINDSTIALEGDFWMAPLYMIKVNNQGSVSSINALSELGSYSEIKKVYKSYEDKYFIFFEENHKDLLLTLNDEGEKLMKYGMRAPILMCDNKSDNTTLLLHRKRFNNKHEYLCQIYSHKYQWIVNELRLPDLDTLTPSAMHISHNRLWVAAYKHKHNQPVNSFLYEYSIHGELLHVIDLNGSVIKSFSDFENQMLVAYESLDSIGVYTLNKIGKITGSYSNRNFTPNFENDVEVFPSEDSKSFYILADLNRQFYWDPKSIRYANADQNYGPYISFMKRPLSLVQEIDYISENNFYFHKNNKLMLYPNPLSRNELLTIINKDPSFHLKRLDIHNTLGMHIGSYDLQNEVEPLLLNFGALLSSGQYILHFIGTNDEQEMHRLIVY